MKKWEIILIKSISQVVLIITTFLIVVYSINIINTINYTTSIQYIECHSIRDILKVLVCLIFNILASRLLRYVHDVELGDRLYQDVLKEKEKELEERMSYGTSRESNNQEVSTEEYSCTTNGSSEQLH